MEGREAGASQPESDGRAYLQRARKSMPHRSSRPFPLLSKHILNLAGNMQLELYYRMMWAGILFRGERGGRQFAGPVGSEGRKVVFVKLSFSVLDVGLAFRKGCRGDYTIFFVPMD